MTDFLLFLNDLAKKWPVHVAITYSKITDWNIVVYKKGCAEDYPESDHDGDDAVLVDVCDCDMQLCFAKAHVALKEWLLKFREGY